MTILETIEQKFDFKYPEIYRQLFEDKMLEYGTPGSAWFSTIFPLIKLNPPLLLFANDYEFIDFDRIIKEVEKFKDPKDYRNTDPNLRFIPFAKSGAGDLYCFNLSGTKGEDIPIVLVWHDDNKATIKAKNLQDFIFRSMLELVADVDEDSLVAEGDFKENILNMLKTHKKYLTNQQLLIIEQVYKREFNQNGLLTSTELKELVSDTINFEGLNQKFKYQLE